MALMCKERIVIIMITFNKNCHIEPVLGLRLVSLLVASSETQGRLVGQGRNNGGESFQERAQSNACLLLGTKKLLFMPIWRPASIVLLL